MAVETPIGENMVIWYPYNSPSTGHQSDMPYTSIRFIRITHGYLVNSKWPSDVLWWLRSGSTMAPSHYLNQCWLIINDVWHSPKDNITGKTQNIYPWYEFEENWFIIESIFSKGQRVCFVDKTAEIFLKAFNRSRVYYIADENIVWDPIYLFTIGTCLSWDILIDIKWSAWEVR